MGRTGGGGMVKANEFKEGMRSLIAGVTIITTGMGDNRRGLTATSVTSLSVEPPTLIACVNRASSAHSVIHHSGIFAVNLLGVDQVALAKTFAAPATAQERFAAGTWETLQTGAPILAGSAASFDCEVHAAHTVSTHTIFIGRVVAIRVSPEVAPLAYSSAQWGRFQLAND
jgi:flavin reductase (DIM6/NTAB) family NADH-FMN oxidoreductase RutF